MQTPQIVDAERYNLTSIANGACDCSAFVKFCLANLPKEITSCFKGQERQYIEDAFKKIEAFLRRQKLLLQLEGPHSSDSDEVRRRKELELCNIEQSAISDLAGKICLADSFDERSVLCAMAMQAALQTMVFACNMEKKDAEHTHTLWQKIVTKFRGHNLYTPIPHNEGKFYVGQLIANYTTKNGQSTNGEWAKKINTLLMSNQSVLNERYRQLNPSTLDWDRRLMGFGGGGVPWPRETMRGYLGSKGLLPYTPAMKQMMEEACDVMFTNGDGILDLWHFTAILKKLIIDTQDSDKLTAKLAHIRLVSVAILLSMLNNRSIAIDMDSTDIETSLPAHEALISAVKTIPDIVVYVENNPRYFLESNDQAIIFNLTKPLQVTLSIREKLSPRGNALGIETRRRPSYADNVADYHRVQFLYGHTIVSNPPRLDGSILSHGILQLDKNLSWQQFEQGHKLCIDRWRRFLMEQGIDLDPANWLRIASFNVEGRAMAGGPARVRQMHGEEVASQYGSTASLVGGVPYSWQPMQNSPHSFAAELRPVGQSSSRVARPSQSAHSGQGALTASASGDVWSGGQSSFSQSLAVARPSQSAHSGELLGLPSYAESQAAARSAPPPPPYTPPTHESMTIEPGGQSSSGQSLAVARPSQSAHSGQGALTASASGDVWSGGQSSFSHYAVQQQKQMQTTQPYYVADKLSPADQEKMGHELLSIWVHRVLSTQSQASQNIRELRPALQYIVLLVERNDISPQEAGQLLVQLSLTRPDRITRLAGAMACVLNLLTTVKFKDQSSKQWVVNYGSRLVEIYQAFTLCHGLKRKEDVTTYNSETGVGKLAVESLTRDPHDIGQLGITHQSQDQVPYLALVNRKNISIAELSLLQCDNSSYEITSGHKEFRLLDQAVEKTKDSIRIFEEGLLNVNKDVMKNKIEAALAELRMLSQGISHDTKSQQRGAVRY